MKNKFHWLLFFVAFIKTALFSFIGFGLLDEGESLHNAMRILQGGLPYRDFFAIFPPLDNYFFAYIFSLVGPSVVLPRLVMSIVFSVGIVFCFLFLKKISSTLISLAVCTIILFSDLNAERLFFFTPVFLALYLIFKNKTFSNKSLFIGGLLLGLVATFRSDIPASYLIGIVVVITLFSKQKLKNIITIGFGFSLPLFFVAMFLFKNNLISLGIESMVYKSVEITKLHSIPFPSITSLIPKSFALSSIFESFVALVGYSILGVYLFVAGFLFSSRNKFKEFKIPISLLVAGVLAFPYLFGRSDLGHMIKGGMPAILLASFTAKEIIKKTKFVGLAGLTIFCFLVVTLLMGESFYWIRLNNTKILAGNYTLMLNEKYVSGSTAPSSTSLANAVSFIKLHSDEGDHVLILPYMAGIYFLSDRLSPTVFNNVLNGFITSEEQEKEFIASVEDANVKVVIYDPINGPKMKVKEFPKYNSLIDSYLRNHYHTVKETPEGWLFMLKNE